MSDIVIATIIISITLLIISFIAVRFLGLFYLEDIARDMVEILEERLNIVNESLETSKKDNADTKELLARANNNLKIEISSTRQDYLSIVQVLQSGDKEDLDLLVKALKHKTDTLNG